MNAAASQPASVRTVDASRPPLSWATTRALVVLVAVVTLARLALMALGPFELTGDEAQYWDWSRRLDWSYYSKGPGIAWAIALSTALFGDTEWAVRLPAAVAGAVGALAAGALGKAATGDQRVGFFAGLAFVLTPPFALTSLLATIDGPYVACWALAGLCAWMVRESQRRGAQRAWAAALGIALGVGFLFKYTILLLVPGLVVWWLAHRARRPCAGLVSIAFAAFAVCCLPVIYWNAREGWPTVAHLAGHLGLAGGDLAQAEQAAALADGAGDTDKWTYNPFWTLEYIGLQLTIGGVVIAAFSAALITAWRERSVRASHDDAQRAWHLATLGLCTAVPIYAFYLLVTVFTSGEANWPIAGLALCAPAIGWGAVRELPCHAALVREWKGLPTPRPRAGYLKRAPETPFQIAWHWLVAFGVGALVLLPTFGLIAFLPGVPRNPLLERVSAGRDLAQRVAAARAEFVSMNGGDEPVVIANRYSRTATLAFYLPERPTVYCGSLLLGDRASSYDHFDDTRLDQPGLIGRPALLVGSSRKQWALALGLDADALRELSPDERTPVFGVDALPVIDYNGGTTHD